MPRRPRSLLTDGVFHVTSRAVSGGALFQDESDRQDFIRQLTRTAATFRWGCHAYCLMTTHYHLLLETTQDELSRGMQQLNGRYAQSFNARHDRRGHLFEGRFKAYFIEGDRYLREASQYILDNPVRAGLCARCDQWPWSGGLVQLETVLQQALASKSLQSLVVER